MKFAEALVTMDRRRGRHRAGKKPTRAARDEAARSKGTGVDLGARSDGTGVDLGARSTGDDMPQRAGFS